MAVRFVLGRSGTGKTTHCVEAVARALREPSGPSLLFLVPEQATYEAERAILSSGPAGYHRLRVLSFNRLQFFLTGPAAGRTVSSIGRQMIVHKVLRDCRERLLLFRSTALLPGFARQIAETIRELHRYNTTPDDLDVLQAVGTGNASPVAAMKFADLALVFRAYTESIRGRFVDPDARASLACKRIADAEFLHGAQLWVDGFAGFTGAEMAMLVELLKVVDRAEIALNLDPALDCGLPSADCGLSGGLFEPTVRTYRELLARIEALQLDLRPPLLLKDAKRFADCPPLAHVERNLFRPGAAQAKADGRIRLVAAPDVRSEVRFVARQIRRLAQREGYRYRDIAVVASDLGRYEHALVAGFDDYEIPYFIDRRKPLSRHPVVELVTSALAAATGGFAGADVFAYLKSPLAPVDPVQVDALENYCLAFGVDGRDWLKPEPWRFRGPNDTDFDEDAIHKIRTGALAPLLDLQAAVVGRASPHDKASEDARPTRTAADFTRAVFTLLDTLKVQRTLADWVDEAQAAGDLAAADEHRQFFERFVDVFDELVEVFGADPMPPEDFLAILTAAFAQMTMAFIPPSLDQVLVGSIERSRHPNLKAVFLLGATQKQFPVPVPATGVLTDADRELAETAGVRLAPATTQTLAERQYLAYIAFTRPSQFLCISHPAADEKGGPVTRSQFVDDLADLFDDLPVDDGADAADIHTEAELAEWLCSGLGRDVFARDERADSRLEGLLGAMAADPAHRATADSVAVSLAYDNVATLAGPVVARLFAGPLKGSATRLATFAACPYKHFARYALDLQPRREFKLEPLDLGNFYHAVLDGLHKRLAADGQNFATVADDRLGELLAEQVEVFASHDPFIAKFRARCEHNAFIIANAAETLGECVLDIARMARAGAFRPVRSELPFGDVADEAGLKPLELSLPDGRALTLRGKIDRLDVAEIDGRRIALVFDYKRTKAGATFDWSQFHHGLNVQLPMYLLALAGEKNIDHVAGAFCLPIEQTPDSASIETVAQKAERSIRKARGLFDGQYAGGLDPEAGAHWSRFYNFCVTKDDGQYGRYATSGSLRPDDFNRVLAFTRETIVALAGGIVGGRIDVHPYRLGTASACSSCDFKAVCRFDWQINDYRFLDAKGKLDVIGGPVTS
ncbi:PD-(D/E)XK nuclease family protein [Anaerobaca lacustris]|uniref:Exodeoxyribonuclease V subunit gamma n=1 Tax=Anaerobaca lacustris TaxID=3044600 RepID=A0AAW6U234_9BACT|nr:exodeoxyribonuclease V subunit gamma [Sedimentisphaerales bacterium M17dextr]